MADTFVRDFRRFVHETYCGDEDDIRQALTNTYNGMANIPMSLQDFIAIFTLQTNNIKVGNDPPANSILDRPTVRLRDEPWTLVSFAELCTKPPKEVAFLQLYLQSLFGHTLDLNYDTSNENYKERLQYMQEKSADSQYHFNFVSEQTFPDRQRHVVTLQNQRRIHEDDLCSCKTLHSVYKARFDHLLGHPDSQTDYAVFFCPTQSVDERLCLPQLKALGYPTLVTKHTETSTEVKVFIVPLSREK